MFGKKKKKKADHTEAMEFSDEEMDQMMDEAGIPGLEPEKGRKTRSKNTRVALISFIGLILIAGIYFGSKYYNVILRQKDKWMVMAGLKRETPQISKVEQEALEEEKARLAAIEKLNKKEEAAGSAGEAKEGEKAGGRNVAQEVTAGLKGSAGENQSGPASVVGSKTPGKGVPKDQESAAKPRDLQTGKKAEKPAREGKRPVPVSSGRYAVQIGSFAVKNNAVRLIRKLKEQGYAVYGVHFSRSSAYLAVYAGPFYSKPEAEEAAGEIRKNGIRSARVSYDKRAAVYKVYAGKFPSVKSPGHLIDRLQGMGFDAGKEMKKGTGSLTTVYIGNFASAEEAEQTRRRLKKEVPSSLIVKRPGRG